jgi:hypothetical protein
MPSPVGRPAVPLDLSSMKEPVSSGGTQATEPTLSPAHPPVSPLRPLKYPEAPVGSKTSLSAHLVKTNLSGKASSPERKYASGVFQGPTRAPGAGFDEEKMYAIFSSCADAVALEKQAAKMGFSYVGDTASQSKAHTLFIAKAIKINAGLSPEEAALSFAYELANASQHDGGKLGPLQRLQNSAKTGEEYAKSVLRWESKSVLKRSQVAVAIGREALVVDPKYNQIAKDEHLTEAEKVDAILAEIIANGKVNRGQDSAFDHYIKQYEAVHK